MDPSATPRGRRLDRHAAHAGRRLAGLVVGHRTRVRRGTDARVPGWVGGLLPPVVASGRRLHPPGTTDVTRSRSPRAVQRRRQRRRADPHRGRGGAADRPPRLRWRRRRPARHPPERQRPTAAAIRARDPGASRPGQGAGAAGRRGRRRRCRVRPGARLGGGERRPAGVRRRVRRLRPRRHAVARAVDACRARGDRGARLRVGVLGVRCRLRGVRPDDGGVEVRPARGAARRLRHASVATRAARRGDGGRRR